LHGRRGGRRVPYTITELVVQEQQGTRGEWSIVWEIHGSQRSSSIEYGSHYPGLEEVIPAKPLSREGVYRVLARELSWPNPEGGSSVTFSFRDDGTLVESATPPLRSELAALVKRCD